MVNNTDSSVATPNNGGLLSFFLDPGNLNGIAANILSKVDPVPNNLTKDAKQELKGISGIPKNFMLLMDKYDLHDSLIFKTRSRPKAKINTADTVRELEGKERGKAETLILEIDSLKNNINLTLFSISRWDSVQRLRYPQCNTFNFFNDSLINSIQSTMLQLLEKVDKKKDIVHNALNQYVVLAAPSRDFIDKHSGFRIPDSLIKLGYALMGQDLAKIDSVISYKNIYTIISHFETLAEGSSCYTSLPIFVQKDVNNIQIKIIPWSDSTKLQSYETQLSLPWLQNRAYGISGGIYLSRLHGADYTARTEVTSNASGDRDTTYSLVQNDASRAEFGINALAYSAWLLGKGKSPNYIGVFFGAGLSVETKPKPRILLGASFITGERNRFIVSAGLIGGFTGRLANAYKTNNPYLKQPVNFIRDRFKHNIFLSSNYSFL